MSNGMREVMERAALIAEASAGGPVTKVWLSKWVKSDREPGRLLTNPRMFAIYFKTVGDSKEAMDRVAPAGLEVTAEELRTINY